MTSRTRSILITGASGGLGAAIARALASDSVELVLHCRGNRAAADALLAELAAGGTAGRVLQFDLADREQTRQVLEADVEANGAYYGVVCNAGVHRDNPFPGLDDTQWDEVIDVNLGGFYNVLRPLVMPMIRLRDGGRIVTISSISGIIGNRGQVNYSAAKAGIIGATKALAVELAKRRITVNCVAPGVIETEMIEEVALEQVMKAIPLQRLGKPEEVAAAVRFLLSDEASYITRQVLSVNGGMV